MLGVQPQKVHSRSYYGAFNAPINVQQLGGGGGGGGRRGLGGGFDVTSLPMVGTFDHLLSSFDQQ